MSAAQHTPGPWAFDAEEGRIFAKSGLLVTFIVADMQSGLLSDANLIAAAPDLLQALIEAREELAAYEQDLNGEGYNNPKLNAAIDKAEGRS